jgi:hypothetical protein
MKMAAKENQLESEMKASMVAGCGWLWLCVAVAGWRGMAGCAMAGVAGQPVCWLAGCVAAVQLAAYQWRRKMWANRKHAEKKANRKYG